MPLEKSTRVVLFLNYEYVQSSEILCFNLLVIYPYLYFICNNLRSKTVELNLLSGKGRTFRGTYGAFCFYEITDIDFEVCCCI